MKKILILTNNVLAEKELKDQIEFLGHEIFCSKQLIDEIVFNPPQALFLLFPICIFSETISNYQIKEIFSKHSFNHMKLIRVTEEVISEEEKLEWQSFGITNWIYKNSKCNELREILSIHDENQEKLLNATVDIDYQQIPITKLQINQFFDSLSKVEKTFFKVLFEKKGIFVNRKNLCQIIWGGEVSNSNLSQLSQLSKRVKRKLQKAGMRSEFIETNWNQGYALSTSFFSALNNFEKFDFLFLRDGEKMTLSALKSN